MKKRTRPSKKLAWLSRLFTIAAMAVFAAGVWTAWSQYKANTKAERAVARTVQAANTGGATSDAPATTKPQAGEFDRHQVPADNARYLFIKKLSVKAMIKPVGLTRDNHIAAPTNVFNAGWYNRSAKPGQPGAMLLDGHASSWTTRGVFYDLQRLAPGDTIQVERGDGQRFTYTVIKTRTYDVDHVDMAAALAPVTAGKPGLNLITCGGNVIKGTNNFDKRVVIFAEQR